MKSNSDIRPTAIQPLGNGAYHYNYNIVERTEEVEPQAAGEDGTEPGAGDIADNAPQTRTAYDYDTVEVYGVPNYKDLTRAVIRSEVSETEEFGLINDYNAAKAGLIEDEAEAEEAEARYTTHLCRVSEIKAMVKADLTAAGY